MTSMIERLGDRFRGLTPRQKVHVGVSGAVVTAATLGTIATKPDSLWYRTITKPPYQPPSWLFAPVWTALYVAIAGTSGSHVADARERGDEEEATSYAVALGTNLVLNSGWSWSFFRSHNLTLATVVSVALAASSADLVRRQAKDNPTRALVLSPYALWTAFAMVLSNGLRRRN